jgi:hypothetical protein
MALMAFLGPYTALHPGYRNAGFTWLGTSQRLTESSGLVICLQVSVLKLLGRVIRKASKKTAPAEK